MSNQDEHTIIVTSNTNDERNTSNHFYNVLSQPLYLTGEWRVGVKKIIYLNNFLNIVNESLHVDSTPIYSNIASLNAEDAPLSKDGIRYRDLPINNENIMFHLHNVNEKTGQFQEATIQVNFDKKKPYIDNLEINIETTINGITIHAFHKQTISRGLLQNGDYLQSFVNIPQKAKHIKFSATTRLQNTYIIPPGNYPSITDLLDVFPKIDGVKTQLKNGVHVEFQLDHYVNSLVMQHDLNYTLGFKEDKIFRTTTAQYTPQLNRGRFAFFLYSNIVENVRVGDTQVPLLDVISLPKTEFSEIISQDIANPLYRCVCMSNISEIEIRIATDTGELVTFNNEAGNAKTLIVLHFIKQSTV